MNFIELNPPVIELVDYGEAVLSGTPDGGSFGQWHPGARASKCGAIGPSIGVVQWWYPVPTANATAVQLAGIVTDYAGLGSLRVLNIPVNASAAKITGGPASAVGNGVKVEVGGVMSKGMR